MPACIGARLEVHLFQRSVSHKGQLDASRKPIVGHEDITPPPAVAL